MNFTRRTSATPMLSPNLTVFPCRFSESKVVILLIRGCIFLAIDTLQELSDFSKVAVFLERKVRHRPLSLSRPRKQCKWKKETMFDTLESLRIQRHDRPVAAFHQRRKGSIKLKKQNFLIEKGMPAPSEKLEQKKDLKKGGGPSPSVPISNNKISSRSRSYSTSMDTFFPVT